MRKVNKTGFSHLTLTELRERLGKCRMAIKSGRTSEFSIEALLRSVLEGYPMVPTMMTLRGAWRARKHKRGTYFYEVKDLWYPKSDDVKTAGRLNRTGESVFYCAPERNFAAHEIHPSFGEWVTLLAVEPKIPSRQFSLVPLAVDRCGADAHKILGWKSVKLNPHLRSYLGSPREFEKWCHVDELLSDILTMNFQAGPEERYLATNLISQVVLLMRDETGGMDGILYPSVATHFNGFNMCFTAAAADDHLKPVTAHVFEVAAGRTASEFDARHIASSSSISDTGMITWMVVGNNK